MRNNERIAGFLASLAAAGITVKRNWDARRDGQPLSPKMPADIFHVAFVGNQFSPSVATAILIDYGNQHGYGLYMESPHVKAADDVAAIARPHGQPDRRDAALAFLYERLEEIAVGCGATEDGEGEPFDIHAERAWLGSVAVQAREHIEAAKKIASGEKPG